MRNRLLFLMILVPVITLPQQDFKAFLDSVEVNNKSIEAAKKLAEAESIEAHTGIYLANPEISYDYLSGSGNYSEMVVSQSFNFPSSYIHKSKIADITEQQASDKYRRLRLSIFRNAAEIYSQQVILNRKLKLYSELENMLETLQLNAEKKLDAGEINILELNRVRSEAARNKAELSMLRSEDTMLKLKITELNGQEEFKLTKTEFKHYPLHENADTLLWQIVSNHPVNSFWLSEINKAGKKIQLQKATSLPKLELGYRQDMNANETFRGIHAGLSIPLFENKNTVKLARAEQLFIQQEYYSQKLEFENQIRKMITEYKTTQTSLNQLEQTVESLNTPELLVKSYEAGQINYTEFFSEYSNYRDILFYMEDLRELAMSLQLELYVLLNY